MHHFLKIAARRFAALGCCLALCAPAWPAEDAGGIAFVGDGGVYPGRYWLGGNAVSVEIDGLTYRGHYAARNQDGATADPADNGAWGRAFLFATSAQVLKCQLATGFPQASGQCQASDGRRFEIKPAAPP